MKPVWVGCSGWMYRDWRGVLYPEGVPQREWLRLYAEEFETVEVNNTFYRLPSVEAVAGWVQATPDGFTFAVKASRYLTHIKRLRDLERGLERFLERLEPLRSSPKLGPVLWQLPANFRRDDARLEHALAVITERARGRHGFEFRDASWFCDDVLALLARHGAALVIGDDPERPFQLRELTADWTFVRLHRGRRGRRGNYSPAEIERWAQRLSEWRERATVFAYFNNDWEAFAVRNARKLRRELGLEPALRG
ncbi:MAG TPA: DUF72 domain-containing protein [Solirubrobacterales bacterium]